MSGKEVSNKEERIIYQTEMDNGIVDLPVNELGT